MYGRKDSLPKLTSDCVQDADLAVPDFGCLYRARYCCSYFFISSCFALRFALTYCFSVSLPVSVSCFTLGDFAGLFRFVGLFFAFLTIFLVFLVVFLVFRDRLAVNFNFFKVGS